MPARVNKVLLLSVVGAILVLALVGTVVMYVSRHSAARIADWRSMAEDYRKKGDTVNEAQTLARILVDAPNDVESRTRLAKLYEDAGQLGRAYQELLTVRALDPTSVSVLLKLAYFEGQLGRWGEMKRDAKAVTEMQPKNAEARVRLAEACLGNGPDEYNEALDNAKLAVQYDRSSVDAHRVLARVYQAKQDPTEARKVYEAAVKDLPESPEIWNDVAAFHVRMGEKPQAENALLSALKFSKNPVPGEITLGMFYLLNKKDYGGAERYLRLACDNATSTIDRLASFSAMGDFWTQRDNATMALKNYDEALVAMKDNRDVLLKKAQVLLAQKRYDDAGQCIDRVKGMGVQDFVHVKALYLDGQRQLLQDHGEEAAKSYQAALAMAQARDIKMPLSEINLSLATAQIKLGDVPAAKEALGRAYAESPGNPRILMMYSRVLLATRDYDQAISILETPSKPLEALTVLAHAYMSRGGEADLREARVQILKALKVKPDDVEMHLDLARIAARQKSWDEAAKECDEAVRAHADYVDAWLTKALVLDLAGKKDQVEAVYKAGIEKLPNNMRLRLAQASYLSGKLNRFDDAERGLLEDYNARPAGDKMKTDYSVEIPRFYIASGKVEKALEWYRARAQADPKDVDGRVSASLILLSGNRVDEAKKLIGEIRDVEGPKSLRAAKLEGQTLVIERKYRDALEKLLDCEKQDPKDPDVQYYIGYCYLRTARAGTDDAQRAKSYLDRVAAQFPGNNRVKHAQAEADYTVGDYPTANRLAGELLKAGEQGLDLQVIQYDYNTRFGAPEVGEAGWRDFVSKHPDRPEGWKGLYESLMRQNKMEEARAAIEKAYDLDPKAIDTVWSLANHYRVQKEYDKAVTVTKKAIDGEPSNLMLLGLLAQLYEMSNKPEQALAVYEQIGKLDPKNPMPVVAEAMKAIAAQDYASAERALRRALELRADDPVIRQRLVEVLLTAGKFAEANAVVDKAMRDNPADVGLVVMKARVRLLEGDTEGGIREYRNAIKVSRDRGTEAQNAVLYYEMGQVLARANRATEATAAFETARDLRPEFTEARMALVELAVKSSPPRLQDAKAECLRILQDKPNLQALLVLGDICREDGKPAEALTYYDRAVKDFPNASDPLRRRAELLIRDKKLDDALVQLKKAAEVDKHDPSAVGLVADVLVSNKRYDDAIAFLKGEVKLCPEPAAIWMFMGNAESSRKDYAKAREYYDESLNLRGDKPQVYMLEAQSWLAERNIDRAVAQAKQALKVDPKFEQAWAFIESIYRDEKRTADLKTTYEEWRKSLPDSIVAANNYAWFLTLTLDDSDSALKVLDAYRARMAETGMRTQYGAEIDDTEGYAWFKKNDFRRAMDLFKRSLDQRPDSAKTWDHLRLACLKLAEKAKEQKDDLGVQRWQSEADRAYNRVLEYSAPSFDSMSQLADMRLAEGKVSEAVDAFNRALALKKDAGVERKLTELLIRSGRLDEATGHVKSLLADDSKDPQNRTLDGMLLSAAKKSDEAVARFEGIVADNPKFTSAHYLLAMEYATRRENAKAERELDVVLAQSPQFLGAHLVKAQIYQAQNRLDDAIAECQAVLKADPANFEAAFNMGNFQLALNRMNDAETAFRDLVKKWPDNRYAHEALAETYRRSNRPSEALLEYQDARRANPKELALLRGMCAVLDSQGKQDIILREYNAYLEENPGNTDAWIDLAKVHEAASRWTDAERAYKSAVRTASANPAAHAVLLNFYLSHQMYAEARAAARRLMDEVGSAEAKAIGHLYTARTWEAEGRADDAIAEYRATLAADKRVVEAVNNLSWLLLTRKNDPDGAIAVGEPYLKPAENFVELYDTVGWAYNVKKDYAKAEPILKHAIAVMMTQGMEKVNPVIACHYGEVLLNAGNKEEARKWLEYAANRQSPEQQRAMDLLKKL